MAKVELEIRDDLLAGARHLAQAQNTTLDEIVNRALEESITVSNDPLWGLFADEAELMDQIVEEAMRHRERPLRVPR